MSWKETIQERITEQPFVVLVLLGLLFWQDRLHTSYTDRLHREQDSLRVEYQSALASERDILVESRTGLVNAIGQMREGHSEEKTELYDRMLEQQEELYLKLLECQSTKLH